MNIRKLSNKYRVLGLTTENIPEIYQLGSGNPCYYEHMHSPMTHKSIQEDMEALPPGKAYEDKFYIGFYMKDKLAAVMDLIRSYPDPQTAYIGFFMMEKLLQGKGEGSRIISEVLAYLKEEGMEFCELAYIDGNEQSRQFWEKNGFQQSRDKVKTEKYTMVPMKKKL